MCSFYRFMENCVFWMRFFFIVNMWFFFMNVEKEWKEKKMNDLRENREIKDLLRR